MPPDEIAWVRKQLAVHGLSPGRAIDVGSESPEYRRRKPHIEGFYDWLRERGFDLETFDADPESHADHIGDITGDVSGLGGYDLVLCMSVLEHVTDVARAVQNLHRLREPKGFLLVTVPYSLPYHGHPIDNMFRPTAAELARVIGGRCLVSETFPVAHYQERFLGRGLPPMEFTGALFH